MVHSLGESRIDFVFLYHPHPYDIDPGGQLGLGLLLLATYANQFGVSVRVINAQGVDVDTAIAILPRCTYLMMYGCLIDSPILNTITIKARKIAKEIIIGGPIAKSPFPTLLKNVTFIDGYGEDLVEHLARGYIDYRIINTSCLRYSINHYPFPDRELIEGDYGGNIFKSGGAKCWVSTTLLTSRGCKYNCHFCTSGSESFFAEYSLERIERELEDCLLLGIRNIRISDDNLVNNRERLSMVCNLLKEAGVRWRGSIRATSADPDMYHMMRDSGCEELSFGIESGDQDVLNLLNKGTTLKLNTKAIQNAKEAGILTRALMMMGTPGETTKTIYKNMGWIEEAKPDMVSLKMFVPYPGTAIYHNPKKFKCHIHLPLAEVNNSAYRPDKSEPKANIDSEKLFQEELTWQFLRMKNYLEVKGIENRG